MGRAACVLLVLLGLGITPVLAAAEKAAAPTVTITSPEPGVTVATDSVEVTAVYTALEGSAIAKVELLVDTMVVGTSVLDPAEENGQVTLTWEATGYLEGKHQVVMRVTDTTGRTAKSTITTSLRRGLPSERPPIRVSAPRANATVSGVVDFTLEAEDPAQVKYVIFLVDNVFKAMSNIRPFSYSWDTTSYLNGLHRLQARAYLSDGSDRLSSFIEVRVDNPSGATALKAPAPVAAPVAAEPAHAADTPLPPARTTAALTPYGAPQQVESTEIGAPGTAPYVDPTGDIVQPPTTVLAERTPAGSELKVAMVAGAASSPPASRGAAVSAPPAPSPVAVAAASAATASSAPVATSSTPAVGAPVQVAALPAPERAPARTEAARELPPRGAAISASTEVSQPVGQATARPAPAPAVLVAAGAPFAQPAMVAAAAEPAAAPAPVKVALLPAEATTPAPVAKLTAEAKAPPITSVIVNGEPLAGEYPKLTVTDEQGGQTHLLPLRAVVEQLHGIVLWEHETKQATVDARGNHVVVTIQHIEALVNGKTVHMEVSPVVVEGRTLVQARFLAKALNLSLNFQDGVLELAAN